MGRKELERVLENIDKAPVEYYGPVAIDLRLGGSEATPCWLRITGGHRYFQRETGPLGEGTRLIRMGVKK